MDPLRFMSDDALATLWSVYTAAGMTGRARPVLDEIDRRQDVEIAEWYREMAPQV